MPRGMVNGIGVRYEDLTGRKFGRLLAVQDVGRSERKAALWLCKCDCGRETTVRSTDLRKGGTASCGCLKRENTSARRLVDLSGKRYGNLLVISRAENSAHGKAMWNVRCDCGSEKAIIGSSMTGGRTISCGCAHRERMLTASKTHGMSNSPEYKAWASMISRCKYPSATGFENYGGRGIKVCEQWESSFENFYSCVGARPTSQHSLDRFPDVDGNYEPGNVRWASVVEQARNKRSSMLITVDGETKALAEWCETLGLQYGTVNSRIRKLGWSPEEALGLQERRSA